MLAVLQLHLVLCPPFQKIPPLVISKKDITSQFHWRLNPSVLCSAKQAASVVWNNNQTEIIYPLHLPTFEASRSRQGCAGGWAACKQAQRRVAHSQVEVMVVDAKQSTVLTLPLTAPCCPNRERPVRLGSGVTLFLHKNPKTVGSSLSTVLRPSSIALQVQASEWWLYGNIKSSESLTNPPGLMHTSPTRSRKRLQAASIGSFPKVNPAWVTSGPTHAHVQLHSPLLSQERSLCCLHQGNISLYGLPVTLQRDKQSF